MTAAFARKQGEKLAIQFASSPPVNVEAIAAKLGVRVVKADLGADVSGLLVTNAGTTSICVAKNHQQTRQRFTIAHELGHYVLRHQFKEGGHVHVDRGSIVSQRGPRAAQGVDPIEIEANQFAACLLMPETMVREHIDQLGGPIHDADVETLAKTFGVSEHAMTIRLTNLRYL